MTVANLLKSLRKKNGMKQSELAHLINVSPQYISSIEKCQSSISAKAIAKISKKMGVDSSKLISAQVKDYKKNLESNVLSFAKK